MDNLQPWGIDRKHLYALGFKAIASLNNESDGGAYQIIHYYSFKNEFLAANGDSLYLTIAVNSTQARLQLVEHLDQLDQIVLEFTTDDIESLKAGVQRFYDDRGGRGTKLY